MRHTLRPSNLAIMSRWMLALIYSKFIAFWKVAPKKSNAYRSPTEASTVPTCAIVTGGNGALGQEIAIQLAQKGYHLVLACKCKESADTVQNRIRRHCPMAAVESFRVDVEDPTSILRFTNQIIATEDSRPKLELVVHNAACLTDTLHVTADGFERTFATNCLGPLFLTRNLAPLLERSISPRVVFVSSFTHRAATRKSYMDWMDWMQKLSAGKESRTYLPASAYQHSKLACLLLLDTAREMVGRRGMACASDPGAFGSGLTREWPVFLVVLYRVVLRFVGLLGSASQAAKGVVHTATTDAATHGSYWFDGQVVPPSSLVHRPHLEHLLKPWLEAFGSLVGPPPALPSAVPFTSCPGSESRSGLLYR